MNTRNWAILFLKHVALRNVINLLITLSRFLGLAVKSIVLRTRHFYGQA